MLPDFQENQKIEAQDQFGKWYVARVVQVDHEEKEVLIHFEGWNARYDEWISCNSFRLRPLSMENKRKLQEKKLKKFQVGDLVQARWVNGKYYPATVKVIDNLCDKATVQFQDKVEHTVLLKDIRPQKKPDKQSEWAKLQQEAKEREDRHTALARKSRAKKRINAELDTSDESSKQPGTSSKKPRLEGDDGEAKKPFVDVSTLPQSSVTVSESGNVSPSSADGAKSPGVSKRKAYTPLRTQYSLRETVVPIQPLSLEQHGKNESSPSKITRRVSSTEDNEDPLRSTSTNSKGTARQAGGNKKGKQEEASGKRKRVTKETHGRQSKKLEQEVTSVSSVSAVMSVTSPEPLFLTPPLDVASKIADVSSKVLSTQVVQPTPPYTPKHDAPHASTTKDHKTQSGTTSPNDDMSIDDLSLTSDSRDTSSSFHDKSPPPSDPKSISLTCFNVDILNTEDDKSASPAVVTIDPNAITHSPINSTEPTSSITDSHSTEERPFIECTKKTASIIRNKSSPSRPSLLPFRRRSLSATADQTATKPSVSGRGRRKSEGGRNTQTKRRPAGSVRASRKSSGTADGIVEKDMAPKELVIKMDHNDYKCSYPDCGKSFRKESLLQWHYKHYHPGKGQQPTVVASPKTKSPVHKSPIQKSPSNKLPPNSVPPTPPTLLAVAKQQEKAVQSATQAITAGLAKPQAEKSKTKKVLMPVITPIIPLFTSPSTIPISVTSQSSITKGLPITTKITVPKEPVISPFLPSVGAVGTEVNNLKSVLGVTTLANEAIKLSSSVTMELLKGSAVRMIAPKPSVIQTSTSTPSFPPTTVTIHSPIGAVFKGFPPVTAISTSSTHMSWATRATATSTPRPSSPGRKGIVIRGHPRGESSRSRGAAISHLSDDSSVEDLDVGEEYRPSGERHTRASRPFGSSSCSYYCSGNKDDVIHCLCGSFEDEGFMIQCEQCLCWQHADCVGIDEEQPPEHYLCCICQSPHALRRNAKFKFDRSWYKEGNLPSLGGGASFTCSDDVINTHKISSSLLNLSQCLHSLEQLLTVAGQPNHPLLKHWDSGKESAITRKLTQRLTTMLKDKESTEKEEQLSDLTDSLEKAARTTPINELQLGGGAGSGNHAKRPLQLTPLPPINTTREPNIDDRQSSCASDSSINVTSIASLQLPPLPLHRRKLFDDESNCSTPGLHNLSSISTPLADEETQMEHSGLDLLTEVAATCSRLSTPSTISQDKSPVCETPVFEGNHQHSSSSVPVMPSSSPVASFMDEFGMEEASVFALTPSTVTTPELDQSITAIDQQPLPALPASDPSPDDKASQTTAEETESQDQNMQSVMELIERLTSDLDTTTQLLPLVTPSQFSEAFMKVDTSCWASRMLLLDHVEAMQEKVLAQMDKLEEQFKDITEVQHSPDTGGSKNDLMKKMNKWCNLDITSAA